MQQKPPMTPFTGNKTFAPKMPPKIFTPPRSKAVSSHEAIQMIIAAVQELHGNAENLKKIQFWTKKLVSDILDYCNRRDDDFPIALIHTAAELIIKRLDAEKVDEITGANLPLKKIQQDDTTFEFAVADVSTIGLMADADFETIKPKLNLYRKVRAL